MQVWVIGARMAVQLYSFRDAITNAIISDAAVAAKLIDPETGADVAGSNFTIPIVDPASGHYGGTSPQLSITPNARYLCDIQATKAGSTILWDQIPVVAGKGLGA